MALRFRKKPLEEPEINLIPFIDVLLVVLIFLMLTTTYARFTELKINLPEANAQASSARPKELPVLVTADGRYLINQKLVEGRSVEVLTASLASAAAGAKDTVVVISADASATHQSVIHVMDAARRAGLVQLTFATQSQTGTVGSDPAP